MITEDFTIRGTNRFDELRQFLKSYLPEASFRQTPNHQVSTDTYDVSLRYHLSSVIILMNFIPNGKWKMRNLLKRIAKKLFKTSLLHFPLPKIGPTI